MTEETSGLSWVQSELKAPKNQRNDFGNYNYRSCEDILEAVKPLLVKFNCELYITDSIEAYGDRIYVAATAHFTDEKGVKTETKAYAREPSSKKGMDESQITGAASSYARKYALNALFLIDDVKDPDTQDNSGKKKEKKPVKGAMTPEQINMFYSGWNGKIYKGNTVYWNDEPYKLSDDQAEWLKKQGKFKSE
jgi:hypothetical protein